MTTLQDIANELLEKARQIKPIQVKRRFNGIVYCGTCKYRDREGTIEFCERYLHRVHEYYNAIWCPLYTKEEK